MTDLVKQAIKALKINVPVMRHEIKGNKVTLWLYGRAAPVTWTAQAKKKPARKRTTKKKSS